MNETFGIIVIIVSDRASSGKRPDETFPAIVKWCSGKPFEVIDEYVVPDDRKDIANALRVALNSKAALVLTSGGTGFSNRDITPEVTKEFITKTTPGIDEMLRRRGTEKTAFAALSRAVSGINKDKLIINLPGSPTAVIECLDWLEPLLPHALNVLRRPVDDREHLIEGNIK